MNRFSRELSFVPDTSGRGGVDDNQPPGTEVGADGLPDSVQGDVLALKKFISRRDFLKIAVISPFAVKSAFDMWRAHGLFEPEITEQASIVRELVQVPVDRDRELSVRHEVNKLIEMIEPDHPQLNEGLTYTEMWSKYLNVQVDSNADRSIGYAHDFAEYCTPAPRWCGFNANDPKFLEEFHGNFTGYYPVQDKDTKVWRYYPFNTNE